jgi:hypothetical protein
VTFTQAVSTTSSLIFQADAVNRRLTYLKVLVIVNNAYYRHITKNPNRATIIIIITNNNKNPACASKATIIIKRQNNACAYLPTHDNMCLRIYVFRKREPEKKSKAQRFQDILLGCYQHPSSLTRHLTQTTIIIINHHHTTTIPRGYDQRTFRSTPGSTVTQRAFKVLAALLQVASKSSLFSFLNIIYYIGVVSNGSSSTSS